MKSRQIWIIVGTAIASFALGVASAPTLRKAEAVLEIRPSKSTGRSPSGSLSERAEEIITRTRVGMRDGKTKTAEPRITLPLKTLADILKEQQWSAQIQYTGLRVEKALPLLGVSEQETTETLALFKRLEDNVYAEEKKHLKVFSADETQIRLDNRTMADPFRIFAQQTKDGIRAILPADKADILISSVRWDEMYMTNERAFPTLTIERSSSGRMTAWVRDGNGGNGYTVDAKFADDGTPIPADEVFKDDRWEPYLKGLTLLPQNEK